MAAKRRKAAGALAEYIAKAKPKPSRVCQTCATSDAAMLADIARFDAMRAAGEIAISWAQFHREYLVPRGYKLREDALMNHVRACASKAAP